MDPYYPFSSPYHETLRLEQQAWRVRMHEYQDSLRARQNLPLHHLYDFPSQRMYQAAREEEAAHVAFIDRLKRERALLAPPTAYDDEALIQSYATGIRASEYQQDLLHKLARERVAEDDDRLYHRLKMEEHFSNNPPHHYPSSSHKFLHPPHNHIKQNPPPQNIPIQQQTPLKKHEDNKFQSTNQRNHKGESNRLKNQGSSQRMEESPFRRIYQNNQSKSSNKKRSKRTSHSLNMTNMLDGSTLVRATLGQTQNNNALKRIENRLRLSMVIFKDSKLRNCKHETNHLFNRYDNEIKVRKQIKNKINCNPIILKKHAMVVK